jgi:hypothetical protein
MTDGFEDTLQPFAEINQGINMIMYGVNGVGKTPILATSPDCVILNADPGGVNSAAASGAKGVFKNITSWDQMEEAEDFFTNHANASKYKWVWLDSGPLFQDIGLENIMVDLIKPQSAGGGGKAHRQVWRPDKGEYGENMNRLKLFVRHMCGLPINFGITSFPMEIEDDDGDMMFKPWFQGRGMIGAICGMVDIIGYVKIEEVKNEPHQVMYSRTRGRYYARDRYMALPAAMVDPTIPKIEALVKAKVQGSNRTSNTTTKRPAKRTAKRAATR